MTVRRWVPALVLLLFLVAPDVAHACPVCFDARDRNRAAFFATTVFMSLLPLGLVGLLAAWLRRRSRVLRGLPADPDAPPAA